MGIMMYINHFLYDFEGAAEAEAAKTPSAADHVDKVEIFVCVPSRQSCAFEGPNLVAL